MADVAYIPKAPTTPFRALAVTRSDDTVYSPPLSALYVGGTGNVNVVPAGQDDAVLIENVPAGVTINLMISKVMSTSTSATKLVGMRA